MAANAKNRTQALLVAYSVNEQLQESSSPTDETLMYRAREGDVTAFEALMKRYEMRLFNYIRRFIGNAADAEDLFQETFIRVYKHRTTYKESAPFKPWVYRIATNLCRDHQRKRKRKRETSLDATQNPLDASPALEHKLASTNPGPGQYAHAKEIHHALSKAVEASLCSTPLRTR